MGIKRWTIILLLWSVTTTYAQNSYLDSLKQSLDTIKGSENKFQHALQVIGEEQNLNKKISKLNMLNETELEVHDTLSLKLLVELSFTHIKLFQMDSAKTYAYQADRIAEYYDKLLYRSKVYNALASISTRSRVFDSAVYYYRRSLDFIETYDGSEKLASKADILGNLAGVFYYQDDYESAKKYSLEAYQISLETDNIQTILYGLARLTLIEEVSGNIDQAIKYSKEALQKFDEYDYKNDGLLANCYMQLGDLNEKKENWSESLKYIEKGIALCRKNENTYTLVDLLFSQTKVNLHLGQMGAARKCAQEALAIAKTQDFAPTMFTALDAMILVEKKSSNFKNALDYHEEALLLHDSVKTLETKKRIAELQAEFENERKEAEIARLSLENELQSANLTSARNTQLAIGVGAIMGILLLIIFFTQRNKKLKAEKEAQGLQIEAMEKRLIDLNITPSKLETSTEEINKKIHTPLSDREFEVLQLTLEGRSNAEIADLLFISTSTVKFHLRNTYGKLGVSNRKEALDYVVKTS